MNRGKRFTFKIKNVSLTVSDMIALEKKQKEMEKADHVFEGTEHFLLSALSSLFKSERHGGRDRQWGR